MCFTASCTAIVKETYKDGMCNQLYRTNVVDSFTYCQASGGTSFKKACTTSSQPVLAYQAVLITYVSCILLFYILQY